jgi:hypothetical protein
MFLGHFGLAFAGKSVSTRPRLGTLFAAAQLPDILWPVFLATGVEHVTIAPGTTPVTPLRFDSYPYSHSLLGMALWGALFGGAYYWKRRDRPGAILLAALVLSHWVLDVAAHIPDMPLFPGPSPLFGLGLWWSIPGTLLAEGTLLAVGVAFYIQATTARDRIGSGGLLVLVSLLVLFYGAALLGPPPPSIGVLAGTAALGFLLLYGLASLVDRHRAPAPRA